MNNLPYFNNYLKHLPDGIHSYPLYEAKASIIRSVLAVAPLKEHLPTDIPEELIEIVRNPPPANVWIPEVYGIAALMLIIDIPLKGDTKKLTELITQANKDLLNQRVYKSLMRLIGPAMSVKVLALIWKAFHRGVEQTFTRYADNGGEIILTYPEHLVPRISALNHTTVPSVALEIVGTKVKKAEMTSYTSTEARYEVLW